MVSLRFALAAGVWASIMAATSAEARTLHLLAMTERGYSFVDSDTVKHDGDYADGWISLFLAHRFTAKAYVVKTHLRFDCAGARWQVLETVSYDRSLAEVARETPADPMWSDVLPKTNTVSEIMAVCFADYGGGAKPMPPGATDKYLLDLMAKVSR